MDDVDLGTIEDYLIDQWDDTAVEISNLTHHSEGWSRDTYSFSVTGQSKEFTPTGRFVLRAESEGGVLDTDLKQEYQVMDAVQASEVLIPNTILYESDTSILGVPFFIVSHVPGDAPNTWRPRDRDRLSEAWETRNGVPEQFVAALAAVHSVGPEDVPFLDNPGTGGLVDRELDYWTSKYDAIDLRREPVIDEALRWFHDNQPRPRELTLVHGDYRIGNMLIEDEEITAVLDWEMARVGDPMFDLGYSSMPYFAGKLVDEPTNLVCSLLNEEWYFDRYEELTDRPVDRQAVKYWRAFSAFIMISILLTGVDRFESGESDDVRQMWLQYPVPGLLEDLLHEIRQYPTSS